VTEGVPDSPARIGRRTADEPIAIVGMAGLFPMAAHYRDYWQNIIDGVDCTSEVPATHWRPEDYFDPAPSTDPSRPDTTYCTRGGFVPPVEFSPGEFGMPPNQLEVTTTVQLLSLVVARDLLRDAGAVTDDGTASWYDPARTGVTLGVTGPMPLTHPMAARLETPVLKEVVRSCGLSDADAEAIAQKYLMAFPPWEENTFPGLLGNVVAGRIANRFDLGGINCAVDAACASSLSALRLAASELAEGRADLMITGGCDTENTIFGYMCFSRTQALSKSGRIRPFDDTADGTLVGEGIGMLALKRLADAERDGDRIYALVRGIGSSSDGRFGSIYAPRASGQELALRRAYTDAGVSPASVELFEGHATGTAVGDRTELTALGAVLAEASGETGYAAIGSVKSQIGHTKGAAGTASLMKLALALRHKVLPPTIGISTPNRALSEQPGALYPNTVTRPWILDPRRAVRRAAASAMGFGGTNFHVVLEEAGPQRPAAAHRGARAHVWHAPDRDALLAAMDGAAADGPVPAGHARIGFVSRTDAEAGELRDLAASLLAGSAEDAWSHPRGIHYRRAARPDLKVAALFAGQGSQYVDMGLRATVDLPPVGAAFDAANAGFADAGADTLAAAVFPPPTFVTGAEAAREEALRRTEYAQPGIGALAAGQYAVLRELGLGPAGFLGHSFGELTALWAASALDDDAFFRLARARGRAMAPPADPGYDPGTMAAVSTSREAVEEVLAGIDGVVVCNHNAPDQVVVGGSATAVGAAVAAFAERGIGAKELPVAAAFHTGHVAHAVDAFRAALDDVEIRAPRGLLVPNSPGASYGDDAAANRDLLAEQLRRPVEFVAGLHRLADEGATVFVEFGPKQVLTGLVRRTLADRDVVAIATDAGPSGDSAAALLGAAVQLTVLGASLTGLDRYAAGPFAQVTPSGMTVTLTGMTHRPEGRRAAYESALADGYRVAAPAAPPDPAPAPPLLAGAAPEQVLAASAPAAPPAATTTASAGPLAEHLDLHARYLDSQLRMAEGLVDVLRAQPAGPADPQVHAGVRAVADSVLAISRGHAHANEVLARLGGLATAPNGTAGGNGAVAAPAAEGALAGLAPTPAGPIPAAPLPAELPPALLPGTMLPAADESANASGGVGDGGTAEVTTAGSAGPDAAAVRAALLAVVAEKTGYPVEVVEPGMDLEADLGIDSIKRVQILGGVAERVPGLPPVGPEQLAELRSVEDIVGFLVGAGTGAAGAAAAAAAAPAPAVDSPPHRSTIDLAPLSPLDRLAAPFADDPVVWIVERGAQAPPALVTGLENRGWRVVTTAELDSAATSDRIDACLLLVGPALPAEQALTDSVLTAGAAVAALRRTADAGTRAAFLAVTRIDGGLGHRGTAELGTAMQGGVTGLAKTLAREAPTVFARALDVAPALDDTALADVVLAELHDADLLAEVGVDGDRARWSPVRTDEGPAGTGEPAPIALTADDVVLATGGARGVTATCVTALAARVPAEFLLLGRTGGIDEPEPGWAAGVADADLKAAMITDLRSGTGGFGPREVEHQVATLRARREIRATVDAVRAAGARVRYLVADVTDTEAVRAALGADAGRVTAFVHGAGALADAAVADKTGDAVARVVGPKVGGLRAVLDALGRVPTRTLFFGSVAGVLGNPGQADYAAANEALDRAAAALGGTCLHWGAWDGGMVTPELKELFAARGVALLTPRTGAAAFLEQLAPERAGQRSVLVAPAGPLAPAVPRPVGALTARRDTHPLTRDPVVADHRIGAHPVLPLSAAIGWMARAAERSHRDLAVVGLRDVAVHRGVVLDGTEPGELELTLERSRVEGATLTVAARITGGADSQPHFGATLVLAAAPPPAPAEQAWEPAGESADGLEVYRRADLFHGPLLQGLRHVVLRESDRLVAECRLADTPLAGGGWAAQRHSPVLGDVVLQVASVLGVWHLDAGCLPLAVGAVDLYAPIPADAPFRVVADGLRTTTGGVSVNATVLDPAGRVLQRWTDIGAVSTPDMADKFAEAVRVWDGEVQA
jgi:acyl transferase domain-containing protein/NADP-dependent 3-hydroxy acid dehydrogenase YdfG